MNNQPFDMESIDAPLAPREGATIRDDLRRQVSSALLKKREIITGDAVAVLPFSGAETIDAAYCDRLGRLIVDLLACAVRDGRLDPRGGLAADLRRIVLERSLSVERLFTFVYLIERTTADELALDDAIGATSEPWPLVAQLLRRASFDLLAAHAERARLEPSDASIIDPLTTLYTRPVLDAVLARECDQAGRFGDPLSLLLFDVDRLAAINDAHGWGVGDRILERLGILIRKFFRQHDWVARHAEDSMAVLLVRTDAGHASGLAEAVRATVEERLGLTDHRTGQAVAVTVSAAVVSVELPAGSIIDPERVLADAEAAIGRARRAGGNRVERVGAA